MASSIMDILHNTSLAIAGLVFLTGLLTQLFILVVSLMDWMKGRPKSPVDQIVTSLGITRIVLHSFTFLDTMSITFLQGYLESSWYPFILVTINSTNIAEIWLGSFFSIIFCLKICNIHNAFIIQLKTLIFQNVFRVTIALVLLSTCFNSLYYLTNHIITSNLLLQNFSNNETEISERRHLYVFMTIVNSIPFFIYCISSILLIVSLCLHVNRMKSNSNVSTNLDSYYNAIRFMTLSLIGFMLRVGSNVVILNYYLSLDIGWIFLIFNPFVILNSIYLIYRTNKLRNKFLKLLHYGTSCMFHGTRSPSDCGDEEETTTAL